LEHILLQRQAGLDIRGRDLLEVGTGWSPVIPLMLRLARARHVYSTDAYALLNIDSLKAAVAFLRERVGDLALRFELTEVEIEIKLTLAATEDCNIALAATTGSCKWITARRLCSDD
jgi:hypothetical protein